MVADRTLYEAIPGLMEVLSPSQRADVAKLQPVPWKTSLDGTRAGLHGWTLDRQQVGLAVAPTIPHHCSDEFIRGCADLAKEYGVGLHSHVAESKVQAIVGLQRYCKTLTAHLDSLGAVTPLGLRSAKLGQR
jgi:cytosine/adenosine deaminase-related metal-dependent hydrolase